MVHHYLIIDLLKYQPLYTAFQSLPTYIPPTPPQIQGISDLGHKLILFSNYYVPFLD